MKGELGLQIGVKEAARIGGEIAAAFEREPEPSYMKARKRAAARRKRLGILR